MKDRPITVIHAGALRDAAGVSLRPGAIAVAGGRIVAVGREEQMPVNPDRVVDLRERLVMPAMVNAHAHLELTAIGPRAYTGDFVSWVAMLRTHWPGEGEPFHKRADDHLAWFTAAAEAGAKQSLAAGVRLIGDIARTLDTVEAARGMGVGVVGFLELFGLGPPWDEPALAQIAAGAPDGLGWQPHAPYSAGPRLFDAAAASRRPVCTHLAETLDEERFIAHGDGEFRQLLERLGKWDASFAAGYGAGRSPVRWMEPYLRRARWLVAHCNYVSDEDIAILAATGTSVAYCPVASEYFGHRDHRYRDMLAAGMNVCLGTDSIVCQPSPEVEAEGLEQQPLGILPQMRRLYRRDGVDPQVLLAMATVHGARGLQLPVIDSTLAVGGLAVFATVKMDDADARDPLEQALRHDEPVALWQEPPR